MYFALDLSCFFCNCKKKQLYLLYLNLNSNICLFPAEWGAEGGVEVKVKDVAGVTEGPMSNTPEALTHQTAVPQRDPPLSPSPAEMGILWEHSPAVIMVSDSDIYLALYSNNTVNSQWKYVIVHFFSRLFNCWSLVLIQMTVGLMLIIDIFQKFWSPKPQEWLCITS